MVHARRWIPLCLLLAACTVPSDPLAPVLALGPGEAWLRTDAASYLVAVEPTHFSADVRLTYTNPLDRAVAVPACGSPVKPILQKKVGATWVTAFQWPEPMCITPPLVIPRGATHDFVFWIRASRRANEMPRFQVDEIPGTYRLAWLVALHDPKADAGTGAPLPLELRVSNTFELRL